MLAFTNVQHVYKPGTPGQIVEAPKDLVGWYQRHPYLQTSKPEPISVGGVKGLQFDVVVEDLPKDYYSVGCSKFENCVDLFETGSDWDMALYSSPEAECACGYAAEKHREIVLEGVKGETVTITYKSAAPTLDEFAPKAQRVLDSVKWRDS